MTSQVRAEPALSATAVELCEAYIFPPISISDCDYDYDYDYEHEYEHGFLHSSFVIFTPLTHQFSPVTFSSPLLPA